MPRHIRQQSKKFTAILLDRVLISISRARLTSERLLLDSAGLLCARCRLNVGRSLDLNWPSIIWTRKTYSSWSLTFVKQIFKSLRPQNSPTNHQPSWKKKSTNRLEQSNLKKRVKLSFNIEILPFNYAKLKTNQFGFEVKPQIGVSNFPSQPIHWSLAREKKHENLLSKNSTVGQVQMKVEGSPETWDRRRVFSVFVF